MSDVYGIFWNGFTQPSIVPQTVKTVKANRFLQWYTAIQLKIALFWRLQPCKPLLWLVRSLVHLVLRKWPWSVDVRCTPFVGDKHILQTSPRFFATGPTSHDKLVVDGLRNDLNLCWSSWVGPVPGPPSFSWLVNRGPPKNKPALGLMNRWFYLNKAGYWNPYFRAGGRVR